MAKHDLKNEQGSQVIYITNKNKEKKSRWLIILIALLFLIGSFVTFALVFNTGKPAVASELDSPTGVTVNQKEVDGKRQYILTFNPVENANGYAVYIFKGLDEVNQAKESEFKNVKPKFSFSLTTRDIASYLSGYGYYYVSVQALYFKVPSYNSALSNPELCGFDVYHDIKTPVVTVNDNDNMTFSWSVDESANLETLSHKITITNSEDQSVVLTKTVETNSYTLSPEEKAKVNDCDSLNFGISVETFSSNEYFEPSAPGYATFHTYKQIEAPQISVEQQSAVQSKKAIVVSWKSVKYATNYVVYQDNIQQIVFKNENDEGSDSLSASGDFMSCFFFTDNVVGEHKVYVYATNGSDYISDGQSNIVTYTIKHQTVVGEIELVRNTDTITVSWTSEPQALYKVYIQDREKNYISTTENDWFTEISGNTISFPLTLNPEGYYLVSVVGKKQSDFYTESEPSSKYFEFETTQNSAPTNLKYNNENHILSWEPTVNSNSKTTLDGITVNPRGDDNNGFLVSIYNQDNELLTTFKKEKSQNAWYQNNVDLTEFLSGKAGKFFATVKTLGNYLIFKDSQESEKLEFSNNVMLDSSQNVQITNTDQSIENHKLTFEAVQNAIGYQIFVNNAFSGIFVDTSSATPVIKVLDENGNYQPSTNYAVSLLDGVLTFSGFDYYFNTQKQGTYAFALKSIASQGGYYLDSELSESVNYNFVRYLPVPEIEIRTQTENSNSLFVTWQRLDENGENVYDESVQTFDIVVNDSVISIDSQTKLNLCIESEESSVYAYNISNFVIPGASNKVYIKANGFSEHTGVQSETKNNVPYTYYVGSVYTEDNMGLKSVVTKNSSGQDEQVSFELIYSAERYANKFTFDFIYTDSEGTLHTNSITNYFYYDGKINFYNKTQVDSTFIAEYTSTKVQVTVGYDKTDSSANLSVDENYIKAGTFSFDYVDNTRMPAVKEFSYDENTSIFTWKFLKTASKYIDSFGCSYQYVTNGIYDNIVAGSLPKTNETEDPADSNYVIYSAPFNFTRAGTVKFSMWPYSSSSTVQSGAKILTNQINVNVKLEAPQNVTITQNSETKELFVSWDIIRNQNPSGNAYTVALYDCDDGSELGSLDVGLANARITIDASYIYEKVAYERRNIKATVFACGYNVSGGGKYLESETTESEIFAYLPTLEAPVVALSGNNLQINKIQPENFVTDYKVYYYNNETQTRENAILLGSYKIASGTDADSLIGFENSNYTLKAKLADYLNNETVETGLYKVFVVASNTGWKNTDGSYVQSDASSEVSVKVFKIFDAPTILNAEGFTGTQPTESDEQIPTFNVSFKNITGKNLTQTKTILPGSYTLQVNTQPVLTLKLVITSKNGDATYQLGYGENEVGFAYKDGILTAFDTDNSVVATLQITPTSITLNYYKDTGFVKDTQYRLSVVANENSQNHFEKSNPATTYFKAKSAIIKAPTIAFYENSTLKTYVTTSSSNTKPFSIYTTPQDNCYYDVSKTGAWLNVYVQTVYGQTNVEKTFEKQTVTLTKTSDGTTYFGYLFNPAEVFGDSWGIFSIQISFCGNQYANASGKSSPIYVYYSTALQAPISVDVKAGAINSQDPAIVSITALNSVVSQDFNGFKLTINTVKASDSTAIEPKTTTFDLLLEQANEQNKNAEGLLTTYVYKIPISEINGFKLDNTTYAFWTSFDYNFEFSVASLSLDAVSKDVYGSLITNGEMPEEFVFQTQSESISKTIITSNKTPSPTNLKISSTGVVSWNEVENSTYGYAYYVWDLTTNTYSLISNSGVSSELTLKDGKVHITDTLPFFTSNYNSYSTQENFWITTNQNSFTISGYDANDNTKIYGVVVFAKSASETVDFSTIVYEIFNAESKDFVEPNPTIEFNAIDGKYTLVFENVFKNISTNILSTTQSYTYYNILVTQGENNYSNLGTSFTQESGKLKLQLTELSSSPRECFTTMVISEFCVTNDKGETVSVFKPKTISTSTYLPISMTSDVDEFEVRTPEVRTPDDETYILKWKASKNDDYYATTYNFYITTNSATSLGIDATTGVASCDGFIDQITAKVPTLQMPESTQIGKSQKLSSFGPLTVNIEGDEENGVFYTCDVSAWIKTLQANGTQKGSYLVWATVATDFEQNIISTYSANSKQQISIYDQAGKVSDLVYEYSINNNSRQKLLKFTMSNEDMERSLLKIEVLSRDGNEKQPLGTYGESTIYSAYFGYKTSMVSTTYRVSYFDGTSDSLSFYTDNGNGTSSVQLNVFNYFENVDSGDFKIQVTVIPYDLTQNMRAGEVVECEFINNRKIELDSSKKYIDIVVDSYINSVNTDDNNYGEPVYGMSYNEILDEHLKGHIFNIKGVRSGLDESEQPTEVSCFVVYFFQGDDIIETLELRKTSSTTKYVPQGDYQIKIVAKGDDIYYSNSDLFDYANITIYNRHMIKEEVQNSASETRTDDGYNTLTDLVIEHGITEVGATYEIYCFKENGEVAWTEKTKTIAKDEQIVGTVSVYQMMLKNIEKMAYGNYYFQTKWIASEIDIANYILSSDLNEAPKISYVHRIETIHAQILTTGNEQGNKFIYETRDKLGYTWHETNIKGYVTESYFYTILLDPVLNTVLKYKIEMKSSDESVAVFDAYVKVTYEDADGDGVYAINYELCDISIIDANNQIQTLKTSKLIVGEKSYDLFKITTKLDPATNTERAVLEFNDLYYIYTTDEIVDKYYFNSCFADVLRGTNNESIGNTANSTFNADEGVACFNTNNNINSYEFYDVYATKNDKIDKNESNFDFWNDMTGRTDLSISNVVLNTDKNSDYYGRLSWLFTDNTRFAGQDSKGNSTSPYLFVIYVNGHRFDVKVPLETQQPLQASYSMELSLRDVLLADNSDTENANTIEMFLRVSSESETSAWLNNRGWIDTPLVTDIKTTENISIFDTAFKWNTNLARGGEIANTSWTTGGLDAGDVKFNYKFNKYYAQDSRLWKDGKADVRFQLEVVRLDLSRYDKNLSYSSLKEELKTLDTTLYTQNTYTQEQISQWIGGVEDASYNMDFFMDVEDKQTSSKNYKFNMESFLRKTDLDLWFESDELKTGGYYVVVSLVSSEPSLYADAPIFFQSAKILAPWIISDVELTDTIDDAEWQKIYPVYANTPMLHEGDSEDKIKDNKQNWADNENERNVFLKFKVKAVNGQYPTSYSLTHAKTAEETSEGSSFATKLTPISQTPINDYIYIDISNMFKSKSEKQTNEFDANFLYDFGKHYFRVYGNKSDEVAEMSSIRSSSTNEVAMLHYIKLTTITENSVFFQNSLTPARLSFSWNCPFYSILKNTDFPNHLNEPYIYISNNITHTETKTVEQGGEMSIYVINTGKITTTSSGGEILYDYNFNIRNKDQNVLQITPITNSTGWITNTLTFKIVANGFGDGYVLDSDELKDELDPFAVGNDAPKTGITVAYSNSKTNNIKGLEDGYLYVVEDDSFDTIGSTAYYKLFLSLNILDSFARVEPGDTAKETRFNDYNTNRYCVVKIITKSANSNSEQPTKYLYIWWDGNQTNPYVVIEVFSENPYKTENQQPEKVLRSSKDFNVKVSESCKTTSIEGSSDTGETLELANIPLQLNWMFTNSNASNSFHFAIAKTCNFLAEVLVEEPVSFTNKNGEVIELKNNVGALTFSHRVRYKTPTISNVVVENDEVFGVIKKNSEDEFVFNYVEENYDAPSDIVKSMQFKITITDISKEANTLRLFIIKSDDVTKISDIKPKSDKQVYCDDKSEPSVIYVDIPLTFKESDKDKDEYKWPEKGGWYQEDVNETAGIRTVTLTLNKGFFLKYEQLKGITEKEETTSKIYNMIVDTFIPSMITFTASVFNSDETSEYLQHKTSLTGSNNKFNLGKDSIQNYLQEIVVDAETMQTTIPESNKDLMVAKTNVSRDIWGFYNTPTGQDIYVSTDFGQPGTMLYMTKDGNGVQYVASGSLYEKMASFVAGAKTTQTNKYKTITFKKQLSWVETRDALDENGFQTNEMTFAGVVEGGSSFVLEDWKGSTTQTLITTGDENRISNLTYGNSTSEAYVTNPYVLLYDKQDQNPYNRNAFYANINGDDLELNFSINIYYLGSKLGDTVVLSNNVNKKPNYITADEGHVQDITFYHDFYNQIDSAIKQASQDGNVIKFEIIVSAPNNDSLWTASQTMTREFRFFHRLTTSDITVDRVSKWSEDETLTSRTSKTTTGLLKPETINLKFNYNKSENANISDVVYKLGVYDFTDGKDSLQAIYRLENYGGQNLKTYNLVDEFNDENTRVDSKNPFFFTQYNSDWVTNTRWGFLMEPYFESAINGKDCIIYGSKKWDKDFSLILKLSHLRDLSTNYEFSDNYSEILLIDADNVDDELTIAPQYGNYKNGKTKSAITVSDMEAFSNPNSSISKTYFNSFTLYIYNGEDTKPTSTALVGSYTSEESFTGEDVIKAFNAILQNSPGGIYTAYYQLQAKASGTIQETITSELSVAGRIEYRKIYTNPTDEDGNGDIKIYQEKDGEDYTGKIIIEGLQNQNISTQTQNGIEKYSYNALGTETSETLKNNTNYQIKNTYNNNLTTRVYLLQNFVTAVQDKAEKISVRNDIESSDTKVNGGDTKEERDLLLQGKKSVTFTLDCTLYDNAGKPSSSLDVMSIDKENLDKVLGNTKGDERSDLLLTIANRMALGEMATRKSYDASKDSSKWGGILNLVNMGYFQIGRNVVLIEVCPENSEYEIGYYTTVQLDIYATKFVPKYSGEKDIQTADSSAGGYVRYYMDDKIIASTRFTPKNPLDLSEKYNITTDTNVNYVEGDDTEYVDDTQNSKFKIQSLDNSAITISTTESNTLSNTDGSKYSSEIKYEIVPYLQEVKYKYILSTKFYITNPYNYASSMGFGKDFADPSGYFENKAKNVDNQRLYPDSKTYIDVEINENITESTNIFSLNYGYDLEKKSYYIMLSVSYDLGDGNENDELPKAQFPITTIDGIFIKLESPFSIGTKDDKNYFFKTYGLEKNFVIGEDEKFGIKLDTLEQETSQEEESETSSTEEQETTASNRGEKKESEIISYAAEAKDGEKQRKQNGSQFWYKIQSDATMMITPAYHIKNTSSINTIQGYFKYQYHYRQTKLVLPDFKEDVIYDEDRDQKKGVSVTLEVGSDSLSTSGGNTIETLKLPLSGRNRIEITNDNITPCSQIEAEGGGSDLHYVNDWSITFQIATNEWTSTILDGIEMVRCQNCLNSSYQYGLGRVSCTKCGGNGEDGDWVKRVTDSAAITGGGALSAATIATLGSGGTLIVPAAIFTAVSTAAGAGAGAIDWLLNKKCNGCDGKKWQSCSECSGVGFKKKES